MATVERITVTISIDLRNNAAGIARPYFLVVYRDGVVQA